MLAARAVITAVPSSLATADPVSSIAITEGSELDQRQMKPSVGIGSPRLFTIPASNWVVARLPPGNDPFGMMITCW